MTRVFPIVVLTFALFGSALAQPPSTAPTLRAEAGKDLLIGTAVSSGELENPKIAALVASQFNCLTATNEFKPDQLQHDPGKFTFENADKIAAFAKAHDMKLIGHNLLWHSQTPRWMFVDENRQPLPRDKALANLQTHITTVMQHFKGSVLGWDVVNEAITPGNDPYLRDTPARRAIGDDYIIKAFQFAHAADPDAQLYYNDFSIEVPVKRQKAIRLIKELQAAGVRIDGIGIQGHLMLDNDDIKLLDEAITAFAALGVKVMITELDVDVLPRRTRGAEVSATERSGADPYTHGLPDDVQKQLADRYGQLFRLFAKHRGMDLTRITFWGVYDGDSWLNFWPVRGRTNHPLLWDRQLQPKPAFNAVMEALASHVTRE